MGDNMSEAKKGFSIPIRYLMLPLFFAIIIFVFYLMNYLGSFKPVIINQKKAGPFQVIYKTHIGPYHKIVPVIEEVEKWAKEHGFDCKLSFGEYLDDPKATEEVRLRSNGGCFVDHFPNQMPEGFQSKTIPEKDYVTAVFEGSPGIGPMKVYPKVYKYAEEQRIPLEETVMEVYEIHSQESMTTTYYFPIRLPK
jgi:effector-binding domain-containing protein